MADEWVLKTGIIKQTLALEVLVAMYADLASWFRQWKNISVQLVEISLDNWQTTLDEQLPEGADWLFYNSEMSLFSSDRSPKSPRISLAIQASSTYFLSGTPTKKTVPSLNFLVTQYSFIVCLLTSWLTISALMSFVNHLQRLGTSLTLKDFVHQLLDNSWRNVLLFFFEPLIRTSRVLSWRILVSVWLIAISFIYIDMSGNLKSKFAETEYNLVDSLADLPRDKYGDVAVYKGAVEERFVNQMAEIDENYRELKKRMRRLDGVEIMQLLALGLYDTSNYLILVEFTGKIAVKAISEYELEPIPRGKVFFSEPLYTSFVAFPIAANASSRTVRAINDFCLLEMETKIGAKYYNEMDFLFFGMKWFKPGETVQDLAFGDIKSVVDLFFFGCLFSGLIFVVEFATRLVRETRKFFRRCRR